MSLSAAETVDLVPLFSSLGKRERRKLASGLNERRYSAGDALSSEHEGGIGFFIVADGSATVTVNGNPRRTLGPGDYFGEMALITGEPRSAAIRADTDMLTYVLSQWNFKPLVVDNPEVAWELLKVLAHRLRATQA
jgi:CRP/FNR family cyclic AMP-dependent transcriptional regulator